MRKVLQAAGSETPPALVGATLSCLEVPLDAKGVKSFRDQDKVALGPQYGLFLFGGEDQDNHPTDTLLVFFVQHQVWSKPTSKGKLPSKRSRHTASVVHSQQKRQQQLLIFGGVGATNAISLLDSLNVEWSHPPARSKQGEREKAKRRARKAKGDENLSDSLLPCARFGHSAAVDDYRVLVFGGADFKGPLDDLYELNLETDPMEWSRPETSV